MKYCYFLALSIVFCLLTQALAVPIQTSKREIESEFCTGTILY